MASKKMRVVRTTAVVLAMMLTFSIPGSATLETSLQNRDEYINADESEAIRQQEIAEAERKKQERENQKQEYQGQITSLQGDLAKLKEEQKALQNKLDSVKGKKEQAKAVKSALDADLNNILGQISTLNQQISAMTESIDMTKEDISLSKKKINEQVQLLRKRIQTSYKAGYSDALSVVLGADSYYESLVRTRVISEISDRDQQIITELNEEKQLLEEKEKQLNEEQEELKKAADDLEISKGSLSKKIDAAQANIEDITKLEAEYTADVAASQKKAKEMESEISSVYAALDNLSSAADSEYVGGEMRWPLPGYSTISSAYGWRFNGTDFHTGIDITGGGCMGANIVAANTGTVVVANTNFVPGRSYGMYVMIDHGGGTTTLYGHCSQILVSVGQVVSRGQTIAKVGSTGWSTGPHLHFEVREGGKDGKAVNPLPYLQG